jgi:hypothetical protein
MLKNILLLETQLHEIIQNSFSNLIEDVKKSDFPQTGKALAMQVIKSNFLKEGIFEACISENIYVAKLLYRSLIEHFLRHQYIFIRWTKEQNDSAGADYYKYCDMGEDWEYIKAINKTNKIFSVEKMEKENKWDAYLKMKNNKENISQKELEIKTSLFTYTKIINYIWENINNNETMKALSSVILDYSELSSYVHGGPFAESQLISNADPNKMIKNKEELLEMTFYMSKNIKEFTYLFAYKIEKKYGIYCQKIIDLGKIKK